MSLCLTAIVAGRVPGPRNQKKERRKKKTRSHSYLQPLKRVWPQMDLLLSYIKPPSLEGFLKRAQERLVPHHRKRQPRP